MKNSIFYWDSFIKSGKISDYLSYRQSLNAETSEEPLPPEDTYAPENRGTCDNRKKYWRK